jgi:hypothetical protein
MELAPEADGSLWLARVRDRASKSWGLIDRAGVFVVTPRFEHLDDFVGGFAKVTLPKEKKGFIDRSGELRIGPFTDAGSFREGLAAVKVGRMWGYVDTLGAIAIEPRFDDADGFSEGLAAVDTGRQNHGYIDTKGNFVIEPRKELYSTGPFRHGLAPVGDGDRCGYLGRDGRYAIEPRFADAGAFDDGRAVVILDGACGFIASP